MRIARGTLLPLLCGILLLFAGGGVPTPGVNTGIPADAAHPTPVDHTFHGCPPTGDGGDTQLNARKNRVDDGENGSYHDVAMATILALTWPKDIERTNRANWSASDAAAVGQDEGIAGPGTGYMAGVKNE